MVGSSFRDDAVGEAAEAVDLDLDAVAGMHVDAPFGVPVISTSPACRVMNSLISAISRGMSRTRLAVLLRWRSSPLTYSFSSSAWGSAISCAGTSCGPNGQKPSRHLAFTAGR